MKERTLQWYIVCIVSLIACIFGAVPILYYRTITPDYDGVFCLVSCKCVASEKAMRDLCNVTFIDANAVPCDVLVATADGKAQADCWTTNGRIPLGSSLAVASARHRAFLSKTFRFNNECPHFALMRGGVCIDTVTGYTGKPPWFADLPLAPGVKAGA